MSHADAQISVLVVTRVSRCVLGELIYAELSYYVLFLLRLLDLLGGKYSTLCCCVPRCFQNVCRYNNRIKHYDQVAFFGSARLVELWESNLDVQVLSSWLLRKHNQFWDAYIYIVYSSCSLLPERFLLESHSHIYLDRLKRAEPGQLQHFASSSAVSGAQQGLILVQTAIL